MVWAAFFNFVAFAVLGTHVARTIGKGVIEPSVVTPAILIAGVIGAIVWNLITWWLGLPTSSSHALIGGFVGAAVDRGRARRDHRQGPGQDHAVHRHLAR